MKETVERTAETAVETGAMDLRSGGHRASETNGYREVTKADKSAYLHSECITGKIRAMKHRTDI